MPNTPSLALTFISAAWNGIPRRSWRNRNGAMQEALRTAISSGMPFEEGDMKIIAERYNAHYWTSDGEGIYSLACSARSGANISAAIAIEKWMGRPPLLWAETTRSATRLYVGAEFTWKGERVTVTSISAEHLVACSYTAGEEGVEYADGGYRKVEVKTTTPEGHIMLRYSPILTGHDARKIKHRFKISHADLQAKRKEYDTQQKRWAADIESASTLDALDGIATRFSAGQPADFRHFDVEIIRATFSKKSAKIREAMSREELRQFEESERQRRAALKATHDADLERWMRGEEVNRYFEVVRLRRKGDWIETSTQQRATVAGVRAALAFITKYSRKGWHPNGTTFDLDQYPLKDITPEGVQVGCTFVEWTEVDRIAKLLKDI